MPHRRRLPARAVPRVPEVDSGAAPLSWPRPCGSPRSPASGTGDRAASTALRARPGPRRTMRRRRRAVPRSGPPGPAPPGSARSPAGARRGRTAAPRAGWARLAGASTRERRTAWAVPRVRDRRSPWRSSNAPGHQPGGRDDHTGAHAGVQVPLRPTPPARAPRARSPATAGPAAASRSRGGRRARDTRSGRRRTGRARHSTACAWRGRAGAGRLGHDQPGHDGPGHDDDGDVRREEPDPQVAARQDDAPVERDVVGEERRPPGPARRSGC